MRADDGNYYVVKFQNNPQHVRVLANELLATRLAERAGLPVPATDTVEVSDWLIENTPELRVLMAGQEWRVSSGRQFGARFVVDPLEGQAMDYLPDVLLEKVRNMQAFAGMLAFDKWSGNVNGRQAVFWKKGRERRYSAMFIDQGYCFNAGEWKFFDSPLRGVYARNLVYAQVNGWESFEPWLTRMEEMSPSTIGEIAASVPVEWYGEWDDMERLVMELVKRRAMIRELVKGFRESSRQPFPNWNN